MPIKWLGSILIVAACGGFGFLLSIQYRNEIAVLQQLESAVRYMRCELTCRVDSLSQICSRVSGQVTGIVGEVLCNMAAELDKQICPDAAECMHAVLSTTAGLPERVKGCFCQLGTSLGRYDLESQIGELEAVQERCNILIAEMRKQKEQRTHAYQTLGLCAGAAVAILLI